MGMYLVHVIGDVTGTTNAVTVTMDGNKTVMVSGVTVVNGIPLARGRLHGQHCDYLDECD